MRSITSPASALFAVAALTASCASVPPKPPASAADEQAKFESRVANESLAHTVYSTLNADPMYYFRHVDVRVDNGVAHLSGYVWSTQAIYQARKIAMKVPGITGVSTSELQLERNGRDSGGPSR